MTAPLNVRHAYIYGRNMDALELIARQAVTANELADHLEVDVRTARTILHRLEDDGWLHRLGKSPALYTPTTRLRELGARLALSQH